MEKSIGYCGYNCHLCAAQSDDPGARARLVEGWRRIFGHENYTAENVKCAGCRSGGEVADKQCQARPCAAARKLESCAQCDEFPCDKVRNLLASREGLLIYCRPKTGPVTEAEYRICMRQFESMTNIVRALADCGRIEKWAGRPLE